MTRAVPLLLLLAAAAACSAPAGDPADGVCTRWCGRQAVCAGGLPPEDGAVASASYASCMSYCYLAIEHFRAASPECGARILAELSCAGGIDYPCSEFAPGATVSNGEPCYEEVAARADGCGPPYVVPTRPPADDLGVPPPTDGGMDSGAPDGSADDGGTDLGPPPDGAPPGDLGPDAPGCVDADGDGHASAACGGDDCADGDPARHPGATELCNALDDDCDGTVDGPAADAACPSPTHVAMTCAAGGTCTAGSGCTAGWLDCDATPGCETDGTSDPTSCGACGHACAHAYCASSACGHDFVDLDAERYGVCAVRVDGSLVCWGRSDYGELGPAADHGPIASYAAVPVDQVVQVSRGPTETCVVRRGGDVMCFGRGDAGELGDGSTTLSTSTPVTVSGLTDAVEVRVGWTFACARRAGGGVRCWGNGSSGQLGDGRGSSSTRPVDVTGITDAVAITASMFIACAVRATGETDCWGSGGTAGIIPGSPVLAPAAIMGIAGDGARAITSGSDGTDPTRFHACMPLADGRLSCFGENGSGELAAGSTLVAPGTTVTPFPSGAVSSAASGDAATYAIDGSGTLVWAGIADTDPVRHGFATATGITDAVRVTGGPRYTCYLARDGRIRCWGDDGGGNGSLGSPTTLSGTRTPTLIDDPG